MLSLLLFAPPQDPLDRILDDPRLAGAIVCATVMDAEGKLLYERNGRLRVVPASNQKLLSGAFALHALEPQYRPATHFWKLSDRLVVDSGGDPLLTSAALKEVAEKLKLDRSLPVYVRQPYRPGLPGTWQVGDVPHRYGAPVTAFTVDRAGFELWAEDGEPFLFPADFGVRIVRGEATGPERVSYDPYARTVTVAGALPKERKRLDTLALPGGDEAAAWLLGSELRATTTVPDSPPDATILGPAVPEILAASLMPSDNNVAEHLLLKAALRAGALPEDPYPLARRRLSAFLTDTVGLSAQDLRPMDGSGLSRQNWVTTRSVAELLRWADRHPRRDLWHAALAAPGRPGTLQNRLAGVRFAGKTGTLNGVTALSGYVQYPNGRSVIVSVIFNHYTCPAADARSIADEFVRNVSAAGF
jgi:serine-type D-Ala-D-Ala carboxypeptidase/endopeptidase (penicillin-binding protein 4)